MSSAGITSELVRYQVLFDMLLSPDNPARPEDEPPEIDYFITRDYSHMMFEMHLL